MNTFKEISKIKKECPVCETERALVYGEMDEVLKVRGEDIEITSKLNYCPEGNHYFYDVEDEEDKFQAAYREYKRRKGYLQSEEIKSLRKQYRLSQKNFARLLNWGDITIHRYESGAIQDDAHNDFLRMLLDFNNFKKYFESKKNILDPDLVSLVQEAIDNIEKEHNRHVVDLIFKIFSKPATGRGQLPSIEAQPDYIEQLNDGQYSANRELALAA